MELIEIKEKEQVKEAIVRAIAFFDLFDYPLTAWEIWRYIGLKCKLTDVFESLAEVADAFSPLQEKNGFYFLTGREGIIDEKMTRYNLAEKKIKKAVRVARVFKLIPWVKMMAVSNIIGSHNLREESDIDLFIITEKNRIWLTRFFCIIISKVLGLRPKRKKIRNKICLSFFVSREAMDLRKLMLGQEKRGASHSLASSPSASLREAGNDRESVDIYFIYWLAGLAPIYDVNQTYKKFIEANDWLKKCLPNWSANLINYRRSAGKSFSIFYYDMVDLFLGGLEERIKKLQLKIMPAELTEIMNQDTRVVINDQILKLHANDRREEYKERFIAKINEAESYLPAGKAGKLKAESKKLF